MKSLQLGFMTLIQHHFNTLPGQSKMRMINKLYYTR